MTKTRIFGLKNQLNRAKSLVWLILWLLSALYTVPTWALGPVKEAQPATEDTRFVVKVDDAAELKGMLDITKSIVSSPKLFAYLNEVFKDHLQVSQEQQQEFGLPSRIKVLSETQIIFLLKTLKAMPNYSSLMKLLKTYMETIPDFKLDDPERAVFVEGLKEKFQTVLDDSKIVSKLKGLNDPSKALTVEYTNGQTGFKEATIHFNRDRYIDPKNKSKGTIPAEDLKDIIVNKIRNAKTSISINVFEFNLIEVANELEAAIKRGVRVRVGVDKNTTKLAPENKAVTFKLIDLHRKHRDLMKFTLVNPSGLNHQKLFIFDSGTKDANAIFSSGNLTQSCIGPEGDILTVDRPDSSKPNANHLVVFKGELPAAIAEHELNKTLDQKLRGQNEYPVSGAYSFTGDRNSKTGRLATINIAFSPNGGMGDLGSSIFKPIMLRAKGQFYMWQFVASAPFLLDTLAKVAAQDSTGFEFKGSFDPPFAMQSWSTPLLVSGLSRDDKTGLYSTNPNSALAGILGKSGMQRLQNNTRLNTKAYGEFHDPKFGKITVKMHNKILILPRINTAFVGTSFNLSLSAEGNQENLLWFTDHEIVDHAVGAFLYDHENANTTVVKQSTKRNARINDPVLNLKAKGEIETAPNKDELVADAVPVIESRALLNATDLESHQMSRDRQLVPQRMCREFYKLTR